jgi:protein O-GlcNAc transferase
VAPVEPARRDKLRLGYISPDFRKHVTGFGMVEMFETHDKKRFELFGLSLAASDGSGIRKRSRRHSISSTI